MSRTSIVISKWTIGILVTIMLTLIPMGLSIVHEQGQQSKTIEYISKNIDQIKEIVEQLTQQRVTLANHESRLNSLEREVYRVKETNK